MTLKTRKVLTTRYDFLAENSSSAKSVLLLGKLEPSLVLEQLCGTHLNDNDFCTNENSLLRFAALRQRPPLPI